MKFEKYEAIKNDFIIVSKEVDVIKMCDRHSGVGADGVIVIKDINESIIDIKIYNADGSEATTCGNGLRCVGNYLHSRLNKENFKVKTIASTYNVNHIKDNIYEVDFNEINNIKKEDDYYVVNSGNLHVFSINIKDFNSFINRVRSKYDCNVENVKIIDKNNIEVKVNERGVGETLGCGSGAVAVTSALYKDNLINNKVNCKMDGGILEIEILDNVIKLKGEANLVYKGEI